MKTVDIGDESTLKEDEQELAEGIGDVERSQGYEERED